MRTSTARARMAPTRRTSFSSSARRILPCRVSGRSPISSRNSVPPSAASNSPGLAVRASVNAPFSWPNSSDSMRVGGDGVAVQLHERRRGAGAVVVDGLRHQFLARPRLPRDQHGGLAVGDDAGRAVQRRAQLRAAADDAAEVEGLPLRRRQPAPRRLRLAPPGALGHLVAQGLHVLRQREVVRRPRAHEATASRWSARAPTTSGAGAPAAAISRSTGSASSSTPATFSTTASASPAGPSSPADSETRAATPAAAASSGHRDENDSLRATTSRLTDGSVGAGEGGGAGVPRVAGRVSVSRFETIYTPPGRGARLAFGRAPTPVTMRGCATVYPPGPRSVPPLPP